MRILMAAMVACLGMVGVHAAGYHEIITYQPTAGKKHSGTGTSGGGSGYRHSTASGPAQGVDYRNSQQVLFKWIKPGTFEMGSPSSEPDRRSDEVQHTVKLTRGFWLSDHEVTQGEYLGLMGVNPSYFQGDTSRPVEKVSWRNAVAYCEKLTTRERSLGKIGVNQAYRLPTEAEWEYAARAGTKGARYGEVDLIGWHSGNAQVSNAPYSGTKLVTHPVKQKAPNAWGLYDMMGNVGEWCLDRYGAYSTGFVTDPTGPVLAANSNRVCRGGNWFTPPETLRSAYRTAFHVDNAVYNLGFRPALISVR